MIKALAIRRIQNTINTMFNCLIDVSDIQPENQTKVFNSRALATTAIMMKANVNIKTASKSIIYGYNNSIDAIYKDEKQYNIFLVQGKWQKDETIKQDEINCFVEGIKKILVQKDFIMQSIEDIRYKIVAIFIHIGNKDIPIKNRYPITKLKETINNYTMNIFSFFEIKMNEIYNYLSCEQSRNYIMKE